MAQFPANIDLSSLNGTTGFKLSGEATGDASGISVASAGDVNGDGFADLIVGALHADPNGTAFRRELCGVRQGLGLCRQSRPLGARRRDRLQAQRRGGVRLQRLLGRLGRRRQRRRLRRPDRRRPRCRPARRLFRRELRGVRQGVGLCRQSSTSRRLDGTNGFKLSGAAADDRSGHLGRLGRRRQRRRLRRPDRRRRRAPTRTAAYSGASYVVFGKASGFAANIDLSTPRRQRPASSSAARRRATTAAVSVASAGDVNGDGFADLIVGAYRADPNGSNSGASYVVFGKASGFAANIDLVDASTAPTASSSAARRRATRAAARWPSAGDVNGDGFADLIVGASGPTRTAPCRRELCGVRQGLGLCRQHRSLDARRHHRLQAQRRGGGRLQRLLGGLGRRRQRRRLRRPDRRRREADAQRHRFRRELRGVRHRPRALPPTSISRRSTAPPASSSAARRRTTSAAARWPRPATSTATASPT